MRESTGDPPSGEPGPTQDAPVIGQWWSERAQDLDCTLVDFRFGVLTLVLPPSANGQVVEGVLAEVRLGPDGAEHRVSGHVMRVAGDRVALLVQEPDPGALRALDAVARQAHGVQLAAAHATGGDAAQEAASAALDACMVATSDFLDECGEALVAKAREALFVAARDARDGREEGRLLSLMEEVEALGPQVCRLFRDAVVAKLAAAGTADPLAVDGPPEAVEGMNLVETRRVEDWVRQRRILERHGAALRGAQGTVARGLASVLGIPVDPADSPLGLQAMCAQFHGALDGAAASGEVRGALFDAFEDAVVRNLGALLEGIAALLVVRAPSPQPTQGHAGQPSAPEHAGPPSAAAPEGAGTVAVSTAPPGETGAEAARLLGVLASAARGQGDTELPRTATAQEVERTLVAALAPPGGRLDARERETVRALAELLHGTLWRPGLDDGLRRRLWRLGVPLLWLILQDEERMCLELEAARYDPLTGLPDRAAFRDRLERALRRDGGAQGLCAVCLVDVDGFDAIATRFGPQVAGRALRALAELLRSHAGAQGHAARLRGHEFAVLLEGCAAGGAERFAGRYLAALAKSRFVFEGQSVDLAASIGVVEFDPGRCTAAGVMQAADTARTAARQAGGARYEVRPAPDP